MNVSILHCYYSKLLPPRGSVPINKFREQSLKNTKTLKLTDLNKNLNVMHSTK